MKHEHETQKENKLPEPLTTLPYLNSETILSYHDEQLKFLQPKPCSIPKKCPGGGDLWGNKNAHQQPLKDFKHFLEGSSEDADA